MASESSWEVDQRVLFDGQPGVVRFVGVTKFSKGEWVGVELDEANGKNDGCVQGVSYFSCKPLHGIFCRGVRLQADSRRQELRMTRTMSQVQEELDTEIAEPNISVEDDVHEVLATRDRLLSKVWDLSDLDGDGVLNEVEFKRLVLALRDDIEEGSIEITFRNLNDEWTQLRVDDDSDEDRMASVAEMAAVAAERMWADPSILERRRESMATAPSEPRGERRKGLDFDFFVEFMCASEEGLQVGCPELMEAITVLEVSDDASPSARTTSRTTAEKRSAVPAAHSGASSSRHMSLQDALSVRPVCASTGEEGPEDESFKIFDTFTRRSCKVFSPCKGPLRPGVPFTFCMTSARELLEVVVLADDSLPIVASVKAMRDGGGNVFFRTLTVEKECHRLVFYQLTREYCEESMDRLFEVTAGSLSREQSFS